MTETDRPTRDQLEAALASADIAVGPSMPALAAEVRAQRAQRDAALALAAEWEREANARQPHSLMGHEIHEMNGEQSTCRAHARELRETLGEDR